MRTGLGLFSLILLCPCCFAADKNGVSPNSISVPKGPGSIEGLGESFQPSLNTGTARYGLGLKLPPGVAGHQPGLGLSYEGGGGNGPLGFGWRLSLPCIQRRTDKGIPTYGADVGFARSDVFINEMKEELVPRADGYFFCENEGAFIRYRQVGDHWEGTLPNGTKLEFGITTAGRIEDAVTSRTFCWLLERETDTRGNVIEYVYRSFTGGQNLNQKYLSLVRYGPGAPPWTHYHFAAFAYEDRLDWFEDGRAGFLVRTGKRLKSIFVGSQGVVLNGHLAGDFNGDGATDYLNRRYDLTYLRYAGTNSHWSLLEKVTLVGADGVTALPPATFSYAVSDPPDELSAQGHIWGAIDEPFAVMDNELVELVDLNADGLPDVLKTESGGGAHTVSINRGPVQQAGNWAIQWAAPVAVDPGAGTAWNFDLASGRTHLADMDGDGLADLVHKSADDEVFFFANRGKLAWGARQDMTLEGVVPPAPFGNTDVRTADVDFDKRIDIIQSVDVGNGVAYRVWFNLANQTYSSPVTIESLGGFAFTLSGVQIADCNGDRVPDIARIQPGAVVVAAGLGYGSFAEPVSLVLRDFTLDDLQIAKARLTDINGDGLADLVIERASPGECWYWLNLGNYTFSSRKRIVDLPVTFSMNAAVRWADLNGNGTVDLVYSDSQAVPRIQMVEVGEILGGGLMPNLLTQIENGIGAVTRIEYAPSTRFALEDAAVGKPWPEALPFPVTVVAGVTVSDSLGHEYRTGFRYHDGFYDPAEKQFRGFARAEQIDVGDATAPTLVTRSYFDTGHEFEAMKGKLLRLAVEQEDGKAFSEASTAWTTPPVVLMIGTNGQQVTYVHPIASQQRVKELGQGTERTVESESSYDNYGNLTRQTDYGIVVDGDRSAFNDERITLTEYALNLERWIVRAPKRQVVQDENGAVVARTESYYDDETFSGTNLSEVTVGNVTLIRTWIDPAKPAAYVNSARTQFDAYGNAVMTLDPLAIAPGGAIDLTRGHVREVAYDNQLHTYPIQETVQVGQGSDALVFTAGYDLGLGTMTHATDFNQNQTRFIYDTFGRQIQFIKPGDSPDYPSIEYDYSLAVRFPLTLEREGQGEGVVNFVETRQLDKEPGASGPNKRDHYLISRTFTDGLGRALMSKQEAESAPGATPPRVVISGAVLFNARQKPQRSLNPCFSLLPGEKLDELLAYENVEAPDWKGAFHVNGQLVPLDLAAAHQNSVSYDATLRPIKTINADGTFSWMVHEPLVTRAYDENDTDPASPHFDSPMVNTSDGLGRLIRVEETARLNDDGSLAPGVKTWTTSYEYDLNDSLIRLTDSQGNVKTMEYDALKRKTVMHDPDCGTVTHNYDDASNLIETIDAKGQRITCTYDGANRMLTEDYHDDNSTEFSYHRSPDVIYHYDVPAPSLEQGDGTRATARNTKGVLAYLQDVTGEEHTSFDARGNVEWTVKRIRDPLLQSVSPGGEGRAELGLISYKTAFEYDASDRVRRMIYPDNDEVTYRYNARSLLDGISGGPAGKIISAIHYLPSAQQSRVDYGNGVQTTSAYDPRLRLTTLHTFHASRSTDLIHFAYDFDGVSNIEAIHDQRPASTVAMDDKRRNTQSFTYDDLYRLTRVQYNPSTLHPPPSTNFISYRYDRLGNMLSQTSDIAHLEKGLSVADLGTMLYGGTAGPTNRVGRQPSDPPGPHALSSINHSPLAPRPHSYDANGSVTELDGLHCTWDFNNRLVAVEDDTMRAEYLYDYTNRRITKRVTAKASSLSPTGGEGQNEEATATIYVSKSFEVRDHDQPTKYVFNGGTRIARITGSLSDNARIQRFRLHPGWNLLSLAVSAPNALRQMTNAQSPILNSQSVVRWNQSALNWLPVSPGETLPAGTIVWLRAATNATLALTGTYNDPTNRPIAAGGSFYPSAGLEVLPLRGERAGVRADVSLSFFDAFTQRWQQRLPSIPFSDFAFPKCLSPGAAIFARADSPAELTVPDAALRIRYYHQDHLGSSSVIADAEGALVEETAYYPFGGARNEYRPRQIEEFYKFIQKERDRESGLHYVEARFLSGRASRFLSVDPKYANIAASTTDPQQLNLYAYARNNPVLYVDPTGLDSELAESIDEIDVDLTAQAVGDALGSTWVGNAIKAPPRVNDAASFSAGFGDAIIDPLAKFAGVHDIGLGGFGQMSRRVLGINNVNMASPDYAGGGALSTMIQFAVGAGEIKAALSGGEALVGATKNFGPTAFAKTVEVSPRAFANTERIAPTLRSGPAVTPVSTGGGAAGILADEAAQGAALAARRAAVAASNRQVAQYMEILEPIQAANLHLVKSGVNPGVVLNMSFQQANAVWVSKFGTPAPNFLK